MKHILLILTFLISGFSFAQTLAERNKEKIDSHRVAFLTQELELTSDEAQKFWPIYNEIREDREELYKQKKELMYDMAKKFDQASDKQAQEYVDRMFEMEAKLDESNFEARNRKLIKIIGPKRFLILKKSEREFHTILVRQFKGSRGKKTP